MKARPRGMTVMAALTALNVPVFAALAALWIVNRDALAAVLTALSPGGSGPAKVQLGMGTLLPAYYLAGMVMTAAVATGLWKLWNWARVVVLAMVGVSALSLATGVLGVVRDGTAGAVALFGLRVGLCALVGWYLMSARVRRAFRPIA